MTRPKLISQGLCRVYSSWKDGIFLFNFEYTHHVGKNFAFAIYCKISMKILYTFVILAHFRIFQGSKTNKENFQLKTCSGFRTKDRKLILQENVLKMGFLVLNIILLSKNKLNLPLIILILQIFDPLFLFVNRWKFKFFSIFKQIKLSQVLVNTVNTVNEIKNISKFIILL